MSDRSFLCSCQKCGSNFEFSGTYEKFNDFMDSKRILKMSEPQPILEWKPIEGRNYVDILDFRTARINGMQIEHLGSGLYMDRRTRKKYDYEEDAKGNRYYFEVIA